VLARLLLRVLSLALLKCRVEISLVQLTLDDTVTRLMLCKIHAGWHASSKEWKGFSTAKLNDCADLNVSMFLLAIVRL